MKPHCCRIACLVMCCAAALPSLCSANNWWTKPGPEPGDWFDPNNWGLGVVPTSGDRVNIGYGGIPQVSSGQARVGYLFMGYNVGGAGFILDGGSLDASNLSIGSSQGYSASFDLVEGALEAGSLYVGAGGSGHFVQSSGTVDARGVYIARGATADGLYELNGGTLTARTMILGQSGGPAEMVQRGGVNTPQYLQVCPTGRYEVTGGTFSTYGMDLEGELDFAGSSASWNPDRGVINLGAGSIVNTASASLNIGSNCLVILPAGFDPAARFAGFSCSGIVQHQGQTLVIPADQHVQTSTPAIQDFVQCHGGLTALPDGRIDLNGGLELFDGGSVALGQGKLVVENTLSEMSGGTLTGLEAFIGNDGTGRFAQSGGSARLRHVRIGRNADSSGFYELGGSGLLDVVVRLYVGNRGEGTFTQTGGQITAVDVGVGRYARGTFTQTGGTHAISGGLTLGGQAGGDGTYTLTGGELSTNETLVAGLGWTASAGTGLFIHNGGTHTVASQLRVGFPEDPCFSAPGEYDLNGGRCVAQEIDIGAEGSFRQQGGTLEAGSILFYRTGGLYELSGTGQMNVGSVSVYGSNSTTPSVFRQTGGAAVLGSLNVMADGRWEFHGGEMTILDSLRGKGKVDMGDQTVALNIGSDSWVDLSRLQLTGSANASVVVGGDSLTLLPAGFDPSTAFASFHSDGMVHHVGSTIVIPAGTTITCHSDAGTGPPDPIECAGTFRAVQGGQIRITAGVMVLPGGDVDLDDGYLILNDRSSGMTGGTLQSFRQRIRGLFVQSGGVNTVTGEIDHGSAAMAIGAEDDLSDCRYELHGDAELHCRQIQVGWGFPGNFVQTGGLVSSELLQIEAGTYTLSDGQVVISDRLVQRGGAQVDQSGGSVTAPTLHLNLFGGRYSLTGGTLTVGDLEASGNTPGLVQAGGVCSVADVLQVGYAHYEGEVQLTGGDLITRAVHLGDRNPGTFRQSGGTHTARYIRVKDEALYEFTGGTLEVSGGMHVAGQLGLGGQAVTIDALDGTIVNLADATISGAGSATLNIGAESLLVVAEGFDPSSVFAQVNHAGLTHVAGGTLVVPAGSQVRGWGTIPGHVACEGTIRPCDGGAVDISGGITVATDATLDLRPGTLSITDSNSTVSAGQVFAGRLKVSRPFTQSGGEVTISGTLEGSGYELSDGVARVGVLSVNNGVISGGQLLPQTGTVLTFTQTGGVHSVAGDLTIRKKYVLEGGELSTLNLLVGGRELAGYADLEQSGGVVMVSGDLRLGIDSGGGPGTGTGLYFLHGGELHVARLMLGGEDGFRHYPGHLIVTGADATIVVSDVFRVGPTGWMDAVPGSTIRMVGADWENQSQPGPSALTRGITATIVFEGGEDVSTVEVAGKDLGPVAEGWTMNSAWDTLVLGGAAAGRISLADAFDNQGGWDGSEALYVGDLVMNDGAMISTGGLSLYYLNGGPPKQFLAADANLDGQVGIADLCALADHYGLVGANWNQGDFNGDGLVGIADLATLADHNGSQGGAHPLPEPSAACLILLYALGLVSRRRRPGV